MGCFLGCFGAEKDQKRRRQRVNRGSPQSQRKRVQNVHQEETVISLSEQPAKETMAIYEQSTKETLTISEQLTTERIALTNQPKPEVVQQKSPSPSRSPKKKVTFNSTITTFEHIQVHDSVESLPDCPTNIDNVKERECSKTSSQSISISSEDHSVTSSVASYPPNHRYHNTRDSDDEAEEYGDSNLDEDDDLDGEYDDEEEEGYDGFGVDIDAEMHVHNIFSEPVSIESGESRTESGESMGNARDRSGYIKTVLTPVENVTQWRAVKSKGAKMSMPRKENLAAADNLEPPRVSSSSERYESMRNGSPEVAVDASLSNWLSSSSPEGQGRNSTRSFEDRPILGALTVEELREISVTKSARKSPSRSPDEMPIIGTVGTHWNELSSEKQSDSSSFKGIPNTTSKYREDKSVEWYSTPFETRLNRALLSRGAMS